MIVAIVLADQTGPHADLYFCAENDESAIERVTGTVLRGPFGGTLVAAHPELSADTQEALAGFAVQHVETSPHAAGPHAVLLNALKAADTFRARWSKAMAAATGRFENSGKDAHIPATALPGNADDWAKLKKSADVKIRGLARSFDRDGVILIQADQSDVQKEHLAQMVEAFARDGQQPAPKPFVQATFHGARGWPVVLSLDGAREVAALPATTVFSNWLLTQVERVNDVTLNG